MLVYLFYPSSYKPYTIPGSPAYYFKAPRTFFIESNMRCTLNLGLSLDIPPTHTILFTMPESNLNDARYIIIGGTNDPYHIMSTKIYIQNMTDCPIYFNRGDTIAAAYIYPFFNDGVTATLQIRARGSSTATRPDATDCHCDNTPLDTPSTSTDTTSSRLQFH